jgi:hypothetical protein
VKPPRGVPRAEWLLAVGLGRDRIKDWMSHGGSHHVAYRIADAGHYGSDWSAAYNGASDARLGVAGEMLSGDEGNPDAYAAGAALAMALEDS